VKVQVLLRVRRKAEWISAFLLLLLLGGVVEASTYQRVSVVFSEQASGVEQKAAELLAARLTEASEIAISVGRHEEKPNTQQTGLTILLGIPERFPALLSLCEKINVKVPDADDPGEEGYAVKRVETEQGDAMIAAAVDERGVLYAVGEILRKTLARAGQLEVPEDLDVRTAPAFRLRGTHVSQGATITELTGARKWTDAEWRQAVLDYVLAGANTFPVGHLSHKGDDSYEFFKSYGLETLVDLGPNQGSGPPEWAAKEAIGRGGYLCLSVPEARKSILDRCEKLFKDSPTYDYLRFQAGDGGGCECEKCAPYGGKYIQMCEDIAAILHKYHPTTKVFVTNKKLDNAGDQAIFDYLNEKPRTWVTALCYAPGSNAMSWQPGRRQDHRMDLFHYPAFGPIDRYLREMLHQAPPSVSVVCFTDVTHWVYSEYGLVNWAPYPDSHGDVPPRWGHEVYEKGPDPSLEMVYDRRTFHARPHNYYDVFQNMMRYTDGDVTYSEGHHDHFDQWMWQRLLWNPHRSVEDLVDEYAQTYFGPEAALLMSQAIFQLETNLSAPLASNSGIDRMVELVREAGSKMPSAERDRNYLWRQYLQKALLDKYIQLRLREQTARLEKTKGLCSEALASANPDSPLKAGLALLEGDVETPEMKALRNEAGHLGEESDRLFGVRSEGFFNLDLDLVGLGWPAQQLRKVSEGPAEKKKDLIRQVVFYEDAGEGGFYDNAGDPGRSPHLVHGWPYGDGGFSPSNRRSQNRCAYSLEESPGVTFEYHDFDPNSTYRVRFTFVRPSVLLRYADKQIQKAQSIYADGQCLAKDLELPEAVAGQFEFEIPREATKDGTLKIWLEKSEGVGTGSKSDVEIWRNTGGWGTLVSEVWLLKG
jgi:hypothetical protein